MKIDIPITNLEFRELIVILKQYPNGVVKVNDKKAIWECELDLNRSVESVNTVKATQQASQNKGPNVFKSMADEITKSFSM